MLQQVLKPSVIVSKFSLFYGFFQPNIVTFNVRIHFLLKAMGRGVVWLYMLQSPKANFVF